MEEELITLWRSRVGKFAKISYRPPKMLPEKEDLLKFGIVEKVVGSFDNLAFVVLRNKNDDTEKDIPISWIKEADISEVRG